MELFNSIKRVLEEENQKVSQNQQNAQCTREGKYTILNVSLVNHQFSEVCFLINRNIIKLLQVEKAELEKIKNIIDETRERARIYVTFGNVRLFRRILQEMGERGLMNGEYALLYLDTDYNWLTIIIK